jgi:hypothetical protein
VLASSLTSVGTLTSLSSGAITTTGTLAINASGGITTNQTTFPLVNATASTINFAGAATTLNIGYTGTSGSNTTNILTAAQQSGTTKTVNIGTGSAVGSTTNVNLGSTIGTSTVAVNGALTATYTPATATGQAILATGKDTVGGTGYFDFFKATNTTSGVTNPNKYFRLDSTGTLQILNSAYTANILSITDNGYIAINAATSATNGVPVNNGIAMNANSYIFDDGNYHITSKTGSIWLNANDGSTVNINTQMPSGITGGGMTVAGAVTSNATGSTAFIAGSGAVSGVALQMPRNGAIRDVYSGASTIYFDVSTGSATNGDFQFRSSSSYTNVLTMSPTTFSVNTGATVTARTPSVARTAWNAAIDTELTVDNYKFRVSNQGGNFPQVISNTSGTVNSAWTVVASRSGSAVTQTGSTGTLVPNNSWTSLYTSGGMDNSGDTYVATLQDKSAGRIYRVTFMRSDSGTVGYNIIAERLL